MQETKIRESNFELLRIIAMFMVLVLHADFIALGAPGKEDLISSPIISIFKVFLEELSIVAVNVFVLISGWFRIKPSFKGFSKFAFQCLFFSIGIYLSMIMLGTTTFSFDGLFDCFVLTKPSYYWFITSYICLYILTPILNSFIDNVDKKTFLYVLVTFFIFQTLYAFVGGGADYFMKGYSTMSFIGLYLLSGFVRKYVDLSNCDKSLYLIGYLCCSSLLTLIYMFSIYLDLNVISSRINAYSNPLIILSSLLLLLYFSQIKFRSRIVNFVGISSFAVYLLHCNPNVFNLYVDSIETIGADSNGMEFLLVPVVICIWFISAVLIDKLRIIIWSWISGLIFSKE